MTPRRVPRWGAAAAALLALAGLVGCAGPLQQLVPTAAPTPPSLHVLSVDFDCATRMLTVTGDSTPPTPGERLQVLVRTTTVKRGPIWNRPVTASDGSFRSESRFVAGAVPGGTTLVVRAGMVYGGVRVFSKRVSHDVHCG